ncbi:MAG: hypothetical protein HKN50_13735 [Gammaproteobacteria bacterium]|nr:hypothetical protein [Gammaproteobacteria bacterium]
MTSRRLAQQLHKWLGLLVGLQLLIWTTSGFYMVVVDIDIIHGDHLIAQPRRLSAPEINRFAAIASATASQTSGIRSVKLRDLNGQGVIEITSTQGTDLLNAKTGAKLAPLDQAAIEALANSYYAGSADIAASRLLETNPPHEIGSRPLPLWRVDFDDLWGTTLYISPITGELSTRRHTLWRVFDFLWMLHIMDYDEREDINNPVLRIVSIAALLLVLSGAWYLYLTLTAPRRGWGQQR